MHGQHLQQVYVWEVAWTPLCRIDILTVIPENCRELLMELLLAGAGRIKHPVNQVVNMPTGQRAVHAKRGDG